MKYLIILSIFLPVLLLSAGDLREKILEADKAFTDEDYDEALSLYEEILEALFLYPEYSESLFFRGRAQQKIGKYEEAISDLSRASVQYSILAKLNKRIGETCRMLKKNEVAIEYLTYGINYFKKYSEALFHIGMAHYFLEQYTEAEKHLTISIEILNEKYLSEAYYYRGIARKKIGNHSEACDDFRKALEKTEDDKLKGEIEKEIEFCE